MKKLLACIFILVTSVSLSQTPLPLARIQAIFGTGQLPRGDNLNNSLYTLYPVLTGAGTTTVTGSAPNFTITGVPQQTLSVSSNSLTISGGNTVALQTASLSVSSNTLSIYNGSTLKNSVVVSGLSGSGTEDYFPIWDGSGGLIDGNLYSSSDNVHNPSIGGFFVVEDGGGFTSNGGSSMYIGPNVAGTITYGNSGGGTSHDFPSGNIFSSDQPMSVSGYTTNISSTLSNVNIIAADTMVLSAPFYRVLDAGGSTGDVWTLGANGYMSLQPPSGGVGSQTLSVSSNSLTISGGNTVVLPTTTVTGTSNQITVSGSVTSPTLSIATGYIGQTSITTLGSVSTGTITNTAIITPPGVYTNSVSSNTITLNGHNTYQEVDSTASSVTTLTVSYSNIPVGATVIWNYMKTTASNCVITFPTNTLVSRSCNGITVAGSPTLELVSTSSGDFLIWITRMNGGRYIVTCAQNTQ